MNLEIEIQITSKRQIDWIKLERACPKKIEEFYNWLSSWIEQQRESPVPPYFTKYSFFTLAPEIQFTVFLEYLKHDRVEVIECNRLDLEECIDFVEYYFIEETAKEYFFKNHFFVL